MHDYTKGQTMYTSEFILGLCCLIQHASHKAEAKHKNNHCIMMVQNLHPNTKITDIMTFPVGTTHIESVVFNICVEISHFAVLYYDIQVRTVFVFDGLNYQLTNWQDHVTHTIKSYRMEPLDSSV